MAEQEKREPYEQPELVKLGSLKELTAQGEPEPCFECEGYFSF